jgi:CRP-like cAMP-binding protein
VKDAEVIKLNMDLQVAAILDILSIPCTRRTDLTIQRLIDLTQHIRFFTGLSKPVHAACCKAMKCADYESGEVIFRYGAVADSFCIILRGQVSVGIPTWTTMLASNAFKVATMAIPSRRLSQALLHPDRSRRKSIRASTLLSEDSLPAMVLNEVNQLGAGASFGELGLLIGEKRSATITCKEPTTLAVLEKSDFDYILKDYQAKLLNDKINFLRSVPAFATWTISAMSKCSYYFYERTYYKGDVVYREGEAAGEVYVIREGEFKVGFRQFTKTANWQKKGHKRYPSMPVSPTSSLNPQLQLSLLSSREVFGDYEVLEDRAREATCTCVSQTAHAYVVSKSVSPTQDFQKRLHDQRTMAFLKDRAATERNWLNERLTGLITVEKYKSELSDWSSKAITSLTDSPQRRYAPATYQTIRKDLQLFSNIQHHHRAASELLSPKSEASALPNPSLSVRSLSSLSLRHRIGALLGKPPPRHKK